MDYGSVFFEAQHGDEAFPGGRMPFRKHHLKMKALRKLVGRDGILFAHTGPLFSAAGLCDNLMDGYTSGEGERGILIKGREEHEYFSSAYSTLGSMWTAAFPEYGTEKMIPFMAVTGQYPHAPLGVQIESSSLAHPPTPGINDRYLRPLWKLWSLMKDCRDISIYNSYNSFNVISLPDASCGANVMVSGDGKSALVIVANFSGNEQAASLKLNWNNTIFTLGDKIKISKFIPSSDAPPPPEPYDKTDVFASPVKAYACVGWLLCNDADDFGKRVSEYLKPYPATDEDEQLYLERIRAQKDARNITISSGNLFIKVRIPNLPLPYDESMWWDLFNNHLQLGKFTEDKQFTPLKWITEDGLADERPVDKNMIWPGHESVWIDISQFAEGGLNRFAVATWHMNDPFYSFVEVLISEKQIPDVSSASVLKFQNELEPDRAFLCWNVMKK